MSDWADQEADGYLDMIKHGSPPVHQVARNIAAEILASKLRTAYGRGHYDGRKNSVDLLTKELVSR